MNKLLKSLISLALLSITLSACGTTSQSKNTQINEKNNSLIKNKEKATQKTKIMKDKLPAVKTSDWNLILVNNQNLLNEEIGFQQDEYDGIPIDSRIKEPLTRFLNGATAAGYPAILISGYRSISYQKQVFENSISKRIAEGESQSQAESDTKKYVATPGASEHHTGLAVDIINKAWYAKAQELLPEADQDTGQKWLIDHAVDYGFILRFPENKEKETEIEYESWHFRYVGIENAKYIKTHQLSLEKYVAALKKAEQ